MFEFKHPKYYKELRKLRNNSDQAISGANSTRGLSRVRPGPGLKHQAASVKRQAPKPEPSSGSAILSHKLQASSYKRQA